MLFSKKQLSIEYKRSHTVHAFCNLGEIIEMNMVSLRSLNYDDYSNCDLSVEKIITCSLHQTFKKVKLPKKRI